MNEIIEHYNILKQFGKIIFRGGGHIGAAGFQCKQLVVDNKNINIVSL